MKKTRRDFVKKTGIITLGATLGISAKSYANILGANERLVIGVAGVKSRGRALIEGASKVPNTTIKYICDVDSREEATSAALVSKVNNNTPSFFVDIRKMLEQKDMDVLMIATPDHWHAPMTLMGLQAGKHVYVEKPCGHNAREGELLIEAQKKYGKVVQMGNQQRSAPTSIQAVKDIRNGIIGEVYFAKAWYYNKRGSIGKGQQTPVPAWLNWDLWQGPAPRTAFKDNLVHYNWHWFWHWGTGEICNNGTHEIDVCRWALGVDYPTKVSSSGGRYHFKDDWEFYDTQITNFEFANNKMISWEGNSCNPYRISGTDRGASIHGTNGTILLTRNYYRLYDMDNKLVKEMTESEMSATTNVVGGGGLDAYHIDNFADAIRKSTPQNSDITEGHKSVLLCHLGNISQKMGTSLETSPTNGRILNNKKAMKMWGREYEKGWEMKV